MKRRASTVIVLLVAISGITATYLVQRGSAPQIAAAQHLLDSRKWLDMLAPESYDNQPLQQPLSLTDTRLDHSQLSAGYRATLNGKPVAILLRSQTQGYVGAIELLIAIEPNGRLLAVKTLEQHETPALGGHLANRPNAWLQAFTGKSSDAPTAAGWALKKDDGQFDQIAGATITSRAVINAVHDALRYFDDHRAALLGSGT
ncbi:RnfABCDGE type electron transport complex subunit G [Pseudomonas granadensis]|uniref:RnfABCDGE type electron transport complex subunit G n=1 Tax=Pseudomonas granadensis TaxID=1421430 RepID=UPI00087C0CE6|nr:RnfABCDGE type electron transport complex subunit G [Pseudomonas granadensis]SDT46927.1 electron transport complex protein RnfG [Pseudomonas granadensis]